MMIIVVGIRIRFFISSPPYQHDKICCSNEFSSLLKYSHALKNKTMLKGQCLSTDLVDYDYKTDLTTFVTFSTVKPNSLNNVPPGADPPK